MGRPKGSKNKEKKVCMSKEGEKHHRYIKESMVETFLANGWHFGNDDDTQKADGKK